MKKLLFIAVSLLIFFAASCSNEANLEKENPEGVVGKAITLSATINNGSDTRMSYEDDGTSKLTFSWSTEEKFNLYQGTSNTAVEFTKNEASNTFTGTAPTGTGTYYAVYGENITNKDGILTLDLSQPQVGDASVKNGITEMMLASTTALSSSTKLCFNHLLTVLKLNLTFPESETTVKKVSLLGMHNKAAYTLDGGSYAYDDASKGTITATHGDAGFTMTDQKITAYVAVFPETVAANAVTIKVVTEKYLYFYTFANSKTLTAGKVVPVNITLAAGHEYVDLGLPTGTLWATMNVGAEKSTDYGNYYAWGETKAKSNYSGETYLGMSSFEFDCGTDKDPLKDYVNNKKSIAGTLYDVAHVKWGGTWKMPTLEQLEELSNEDNCSRVWQTNYNGSGKNGWLLTSKKTRKTIFLPAGGYGDDSSFSDQGSYGLYWSASPLGSEDFGACDAYNLDFGSGESKCFSHSRYYGQSVRPVSE